MPARRGGGPRVLTVEILELPIDQMNPAPYNPREDLQPGDPRYEMLKKSMNQFGAVEPLVWNRVTGRLVGGHQRLKVLKDLGHATVTVSVVELDEKKERALNVALNKLGGRFHLPKLKELLVSIDDGEMDLSLTGFDTLELEALIVNEAPDESEKPRAAGNLTYTLVFDNDDQYRHFQIILARLKKTPGPGTLVDKLILAIGGQDAGPGD